MKKTFQGFNATLTEPVDNQGRRGDQIKEMDLNLHPELKGPLKALCSDPSTTIVVLSGSSRSILDKVCLSLLFFPFLVITLSLTDLVLYLNSELWRV